MKCELCNDDCPTRGALWNAVENGSINEILVACVLAQNAILDGCLNRYLEQLRQEAFRRIKVIEQQETVV